MQFRSSAMAIAIASIAATGAQASTCPTGNRVADPAAFVWTDEGDHFSGTMEISEETFIINGETLTTRAYGQAGSAPSIPAPTITVEPGKKYVMRFHNKLPYEAPSTEHNVFKDPNIANLHTHGLHISGESPGDDVTRSFEGGFGGDFVYDIPADHMGGTYWYHAHHHGSTYLQVAGGAFGLLVVDDNADGLPNPVKNMKERQLLIAKLDPTAAGTGGDTLMSGTLGATWTTNGKVQGDVCMPVNEWQHFRVLIADANAMEKNVVFGSNCQVALLARDGVWRTTAPKMLTGNSIGLTGASRADFAVKCSGDATITVANTVVANIYADASLPAVTDASVAGPYDENGQSWSATRPAYLRDLSGVTDVNTESVTMGARTINGTAFDADVPTFTVTPDKVQSWSVSGAQRHPFHLHVYHVQTQGCGGDFEDGEYYDVVGANCNVRFDLNANTLGTSAYEGRTIMHCHILDHEDQGAMGWMDVLPSSKTIAPPTFPTGKGYSDYYAFGSEPPPPATVPNAPSNLSASATGSSSIALSWSDNSSDEDSFEIERSLDGSNFSMVASVGANTTSHTDTGLSAETTYTYRVSASNSAGSSSPSNTASATTSAAPVGSSVQVGSITVTTVSAGAGSKKGQATIVVVDNVGNLVSGAVVTGDFTGTFTDHVVSNPTDANGSTTVQTSGSAKRVTVGFCVTGISHPSLTDWSGSVCSN